MSSDTPRTDARECEMHYNWVGASMRACRDGGWVEADFARELERELAAALRERDQLRKANEGLLARMDYAERETRPLQMELDASCNAEELRQARAERDQLRAELARARQTIEDVCCGGGA